MGMDDLNDYLAGQVLKYAGALEYVEDFEREHRNTLRDPEGRAALTMAYQQAQADGQAHGGQQCCGTAADWHRPWCETGPRRYRARSGLIRIEVTSEADVTRMVAAFNMLPVLLGSDYEIFIGSGVNGPVMMRRAWRTDGQRGATQPTDWTTPADDAG